VGESHASLILIIIVTVIIIVIVIIFSTHVYSVLACSIGAN
jgi:uncharacterized membrane protein YqiK